MIGHYLTVALRNIRRHKLNTAIKIVALAMGLTCFISAHLVREFVEGADGHFAKSDRTFVIEQAVKRPDMKAAMAYAPFAAAPAAKYLKADFPQLEAVARATVYDDTPIKAGDNKSYRQVLMVDPAFLRVFDLPFAAGDPEKALEAPRSAVLSADAATAIFGTADAIGRTIRLFSNADVTVTGIVKEFPRPSHLTTLYRNSTLDMLVSMDTEEAIRSPMMPSARDGAPEVWAYGGYFTYVVLPADGSLAKSDFEKRLATFGTRHIPADQGSIQFKAIPVAQMLTAVIDSLMLNGGLGMPFTTILEIFGALVLVVACLDFINLATAEAFARAKEIGMRKVMGASRLEVAAQTLFEVVLLAVIALGLSFAILVPFSAFVRPDSTVVTSTLVLGVGFWIFVAFVLIVASVLAGGYPALVTARVRPVLALRAAKNKSGSKLFRATLVGAQFCAASLLLVMVVVMLHQSREVERVAVNRLPDPYVFIPISTLAAKIDGTTFRDQLLQSPYIKGVTGYQTWPFNLMSFQGALSRSPDTGGARITVQRRIVNDDFFKTMDIKILAGRELSADYADDTMPMGDAEMQARTRPVDLVVDLATSEALGFASPEAAIGQAVYADYTPMTQVQGTRPPLQAKIVGVTENTPIQVVTSGSHLFIYGYRREGASLPIIRLDKDHVKQGLAYIREVWDRLSPDVPVRLVFLDQRFDESFVLFRFIQTSFLATAAFAVIIASLGLFGMAAYIVGRRRNEIGVRKTLGASTPQILHMLLWDFSKPIVIANLIAWPIAFAGAQIYLNLFTTRVSITLVPFAVSLLVTILIAGLAVASQTLSAARLNPASVLKYE
jgi:putative ABC transport system permease protein